jgi:hypothetical protein
MTDNELKENGWNPMLCKIGTLYFKDNFFCKLRDNGIVSIYSVNDDMNPIGTVTTIDGIFGAIKHWYRLEIEAYKRKTEQLEKEYFERYGEKYVS